MNKRINHHYFISLFLVASINVNAQGQYASEVDIKASYCLGATNRLSESTDKSDPLLVEFINLNNVNYTRLENFLITRVKSMNSAANNEMMAALTAGQEASQRSSLIIAACFKELSPNNGVATDAFTTKMLQDCKIRKHGESEVRRLEKCYSLDFLPY